MVSSDTVMNLFDLTQKTALVTGGTGWLGRAMAEGLAEAGATVIISSRERARAERIANSLVTESGQKHRAIQLDHMIEDSIAAGFQDALEGGTIDILVNNGLEILGDDLNTVAFEDFAKHQVNNAGYFELSRKLHRHAVDRKSPASIINIGSMYGQVASYPDAYEGICQASSVAYHALKGGTIHMTRHLAVYWASDSVRVNCISPGPFPNPDSAPRELVDRLKQKSPMKRMGRPNELKGAVVFFASAASSYVTGQNLTVDGGWTAW